MAENNDRNPNSYAATRAALDEAFDLAIDALGQDPPTEDKGPWSVKAFPYRPKTRV